MNMPQNEYHLLFSGNGPTAVKVKFKDFDGSISGRKMEPAEIARLVSQEGRGFLVSMTFDEWPFEVFKYEIDPIRNTLTLQGTSKNFGMMRG